MVATEPASELDRPASSGARPPGLAWLGWLWLASAGLRISAGFRLDFGLILASAGFGLILVWLDLDLACFRLDLA